MQEAEEGFSFKSFFSPLTTFKAIHIIVIIGLIVFGNMLFNGFVWDDETQILGKPVVHSLQYIGNIFLGKYTLFNQEILFDQYYRPIYFLTISIVYSLFGPTAFFFHLWQLVIHILNAILIFLLFSHFFKRSLSFVISLIFLVHPINVESVSYISSINNPQFLLFGLSALLLAIRAKLNSVLFFIISFLLLLALLTRESGILFIVVLVLYFLLFDKKNLISMFIASLGTLLAFGTLRVLVDQTTFHKLTYMSLMNAPFLERIINIPKIIFFYLHTFFFPKTLSIFQVWQVKQLNFSDFYFPLLIDTIFFICVIVLGIFFYQKDKVLFRKYLFFSIWFVLGIGAHLQIVPLDATVADRWFYFPMIGMLGILAVLLQTILKNPKAMKLASLCVVILLIVLSLRTMVRNTNWHNPLVLYNHDIATSPGNFELENSLGIALMTDNRNKEAIAHFESAIKLFPNNVSFSNIGVAYEALGNKDKALYFYEKSIFALSLYQGIGMNPDIKVYENLGTFYLKYKDSFITEKFAKDSLRKFPYSAKLWMILAIVEYKQGLTKEALAAAKKANELETNPAFNEYYLKMKNNIPIDINK